ncbi:MAG: beta-lactamase family protein [Chitinophagales bacterium]|nr:beta-lactamase family protein [Chitinophagales bacterium]
MKLKALTVWLSAVALLMVFSSFTWKKQSVACGATNENCSEEVSFQSLADYAAQRAYSQIDSFYRLRHKAGFNGCVMIAKDGKPIYSGAFGYADYKKDTLTTQTAIQLASVTKTFTSSAIMLLAENGFLSVDDTLQKFFPDFPYKGMTIKHLLTHRSGLQEYIYWGSDYVGSDVKYLTNEKLLQTIITKKPPLRWRVDLKFTYCNTNYALLASVIEHVTGMSYAKFMNDVIFTPLGMTSTFAYTLEDPTTLCGAKCFDSRWRVWKEIMSDGVLGDKGIYSSVEDMLKWDNALRNGMVLNETSLSEAYKPRSFDRYSFTKDKEKNYGYGWRMIKQSDDNYLIYHNGNWHGCNNVFARDMKDGYTIIVLGNKANENNYWTQPVWDFLTKMNMVEDVAEVQ